MVGKVEIKVAFHERDPEFDPAPPENAGWWTQYKYNKFVELGDYTHVEIYVPANTDKRSKVWRQGMWVSSVERHGVSARPDMQRKRNYKVYAFDVTREQHQKMIEFICRQLKAQAPHDEEKAQWAGVFATIGFCSGTTDEKSWYCSELVVFIMHLGGVLEDIYPAHSHPSMLYTRIKGDVEAAEAAGKPGTFRYAAHSKEDALAKANYNKTKTRMGRLAARLQEGQEAMNKKK